MDKQQANVVFYSQQLHFASTLKKQQQVLHFPRDPITWK